MRNRRSVEFRQIPFRGHKCVRINFLYSWRVRVGACMYPLRIHSTRRNGTGTHKKPVLFYLRLVKITWYVTENGVSRDAG